MFRLSNQPLVAAPLDFPGAGGFVVFEGKVRNDANGRAVLQLEYQAYPELAQTEGDALIQESIDRFGLIYADIGHRTGTLAIGETAVVIQVAAAHRREAFAACEWLIDQLKWRVPIWKRETYADGDSGWVGAGSQPVATDGDAAFFRRQIALDEVGLAGQERLCAASVLIVGVGGLGSGCLPPLVGAGIGRIGLIDGDDVDVSNLHRQTLYRAEDVGRSKVERAAAFATRLCPTIRVETFPERLTEQNVDALVMAYDWVVDGTDSIAVKFLLNAACKRHGKSLVTASVHRFEGQLMTIEPDGPCLQCLFPETPPEGCVGTCGETGVLGVLPLLFGTLQANEVLKGILGYGPTLSHDALLLDLRNGATTKLRRDKRIGCRGCLGEWEASTIDLTWPEAREMLGRLTLIDMRESPEFELPIAHIRMSAAEALAHPPNGAVALCCHRGVLSAQIAQRLRQSGRNDVYSLKGGAQSLPR